MSGGASPPSQPPYNPGPPPAPVTATTPAQNNAAGILPQQFAGAGQAGQQQAQQQNKSLIGQ